MMNLKYKRFLITAFGDTFLNLLQVGGETPPVLILESAPSVDSGYKFTF